MLEVRLSLFIYRRIGSSFSFVDIFDKGQLVSRIADGSHEGVTRRERFLIVLVEDLVRCLRGVFKGGLSILYLPYIQLP